MRPSYRYPRPGRARRILALAGSAAAIALAGCASATAPHGSPGASLTGTTATPQATGATRSPAAATPAQRAKAEAARMTRAFAAAVGAQEVTGSPVPGSLLNDGGPMGRSQDADMVVTTTWWLAPGKPQAELALAAARLRPAFDDGGSGTTGTDIRGDRFTLPPVAGLFNERTLDVSVTAAGHGQTAIRVDAVVGWIPPRPDGDTVPASARLATVTLSWLDPGKPGRPTTKTVTVTDQGRVRALAAYLDHQPVSPPVAYGCPAGMPGGVTVEFRARPAGPVLAKATGDGSGCGFVSYTMPGHPMTGIGGAGAAAALLAEVNRVAGVHWTFDKP